MAERSLFVLQGGGPTPVINATLAGIADAASGVFDHLIGLPNGFEGLRPPIDLSALMGQSREAHDCLTRTPGALLGSSRRKVREEDLAQILTQMSAAGSDALIGIGGNGTLAMLDRLAALAEARGRPLRVIGAPKTVDNDLPCCHVAPGYGSAARFIALAVRDFDRDFKAMATFDQVTILETMGRDTGWLAAAATLLRPQGGAPHMVLVPERPLDEDKFLSAVAATHASAGRVFIVVNEMLRGADGAIVGAGFQDGPRDELGRVMYSLSLGTGNYLTSRIWRELGLQARCLRPGSLGRALSFCVSEPDRDLALTVGRAAVESLIAGATRQVISVAPDLIPGLAPLTSAVGTRALSARFLEGPHDISDDFAAYARAVIGPVEPLFEFH